MMSDEFRASPIVFGIDDLAYASAAWSSKAASTGKPVIFTADIAILDEIGEAVALFGNYRMGYSSNQRLSNVDGRTVYPSACLTIPVAPCARIV